MKAQRNILIDLIIIVLSFAGLAMAQYNDPYMQQPVWAPYSWYFPNMQPGYTDQYQQWGYESLNYIPGFGYIPQTEGEYAAWQQQYDLEFQRFLQQNQQQWNQVFQQAQQEFINYYRQHTGDYNTPDAQAAILGDRLWCQNNPVQCQQSNQAHAQRMQDINAWGQAMLQNGRDFSNKMDRNHQLFLEYIRQ